MRSLGLLVYLVSGVVLVAARPYNDGLSRQYQEYYKNQYQQYYFAPTSPYNSVPYNQQAASLSQAQDVSDVTPNVISQMTDLERDVSGFRDAMANMAEAMLVNKANKDGGFTVEEKVKEDKDYTSKKHKLMSARKVGNKVKHERSRFEREMVKFFTNFMCGKDC